MAADIRQHLHLKTGSESSALRLFSAGLCRKEGEGGELGVFLMTLGELHKRPEATAAFHAPSTH